MLGHAQLTTTQIYTTPRQEDVIRRLLLVMRPEGDAHPNVAVPYAAAEDGYLPPQLTCL